MPGDEGLASVVRELLGRLLTATEATARALEQVAGELRGMSARLDTTDRHTEAAEDALVAIKPLLAELADKRLAERLAETQAAEARGYARAQEEERARQAAAVDVAARSAVAAAFASSPGRIAVGLIIVVLLLAGATMLLPYVNLGALADVLRFGGGAP